MFLRKNIYLEEKSKETIGNLYYARDNFLKPKNWKNIVIITSDSHIKRTKYIAEKVFGQKYKIDVVGVPSGLPESQFKKELKKEKKLILIDKVWLAFIKKHK